jgi:hypothetical protein
MGGAASEDLSAFVEGLPPAQLGVSARPSRRQLLVAWRWGLAVSAVTLVSAVAAVWITLRASFLAYPGWLALQKADFILGPVGVGLYWRHRRPANRLGLMLIALGFVGVPYILESTTTPALFGIGVEWEYAIYAMTTVVILAFPNGRLDGPVERLILAAVLVGLVLPSLIFALTLPDSGPSFAISGCRTVCPANGLAVWSPPSWTFQLTRFAQVMSIVIPVATAGLLVWRFRSATPPRRRALAIGAPIALLFLLMQATYRTITLLSPQSAVPSTHPVADVIQWTFVGARAAIWYGFLFALIAAELFAGRTLRRLVGDSLGRPSLAHLQAMVRAPLGDPKLRLGFWRPSTRDWVSGDGAVLAPPETGQS